MRVADSRSAPLPGPESGFAFPDAVPGRLAHALPCRRSTVMRLCQHASGFRHVGDRNRDVRHEKVLCIDRAAVRMSFVRLAGAGRAGRQSVRQEGAGRLFRLLFGRASERRGDERVCGGMRARRRALRRRRLAGAPRPGSRCGGRCETECLRAQCAPRLRPALPCQERPGGLQGSLPRRGRSKLRRAVLKSRATSAGAAGPQAATRTAQEQTRSFIEAGALRPRSCRTDSCDKAPSFARWQRCRALSPTATAAGRPGRCPARSGRRANAGPDGARRTAVSIRA